MSNRLYFVSKNVRKTDTIKHIFKQHGVEIEQLAIDTPEIQSDSTEEVASYSAKYAAELSGQRVIKEDFGVRIESLRGFPGPFVKYVNNWLTSSQFIKLYDSEPDKKAYYINTLAYCAPGNNTVCFTDNVSGKMITAPLGNNECMIDSLFIPDGYEKTIAQMTEAELLNFWSRDIYFKIIQYLKTI